MTPFAFHDVNEEDFPMVFEYLNAAGEVVDSITVTGPGAIEVPALAETHGPITVRCTFGTGRVVIQHPPPS